MTTMQTAVQAVPQGPQKGGLVTPSSAYGLGKVIIKRLLVVIIVLAWAIMRLTGVSLSMGGVWSWILMIFCLGVMMFEFWKSADISTSSFRTELGIAIAALYAIAQISSYLWWTKGSWFLIDGVVTALVLADTWLSTFNSYRTGLRNFQGGVDTPAPDA